MFWSLWVWSFKTAYRIAFSNKRNKRRGRMAYFTQAPHSLLSLAPQVPSHCPWCVSSLSNKSCAALVPEFNVGIFSRVICLLLIGLSKSRVLILWSVKWTRRPLITKKLYVRTSLAAQWLRLHSAPAPHPAIHGAQVQSLVRELDPTRHS